MYLRLKDFAPEEFFIFEIFSKLLYKAYNSPEEAWFAYDWNSRDVLYFDVFVYMCQDIGFRNFASSYRKVFDSLSIMTEDERSLGALFKHDDGCKSFIDRHTFCEFIARNFGPNLRGEFTSLILYVYCS